MFVLWKLQKKAGVVCKNYFDAFPLDTAETVRVSSIKCVTVLFIFSRQIPFWINIEHLPAITKTIIIRHTPIILLIQVLVH